MENFYTSIEPLCVFLRFLGFFPRTFINPVYKGHLSKTNFALIQTAIGIMIMLTLIFGSIMHYYFYEVYLLDFLTYPIWTYIFIFGTVQFFLECIYQIYKVNDIKLFFKQMQSIDIKLQRLDILVDHSRQRNIVKNVTLSIVVLMIVRIPLVIAFYKFIFNFYQTQVLLSEIMYCFMLIYECLFCLQFIIPTYLLRERFEALKNFLR